MPKKQWVTPKTDWSESDFFNLSDYERITGNLYWLVDAAYSLFPTIPISEMREKKLFTDLFYASDMNAIENNLALVNDMTYGYDIGDTIEYSDNGQTPTFDEYNRIESATLMIHDQLLVDNKYLYRLPFAPINDDLHIGGGNEESGNSMDTMKWGEASNKTWSDYSSYIWKKGRKNG